jgi:IclR family pca regulon transcriptional regulator
VSADPDYMLSLARGLAVIRSFGTGRGTLSVAEVAREVGISRAAARRCLHTLSVLGYASSTNGAYELGPSVLTLGYAYLASTPAARVAQPILERVTDRLHESCSLAGLDGDEIVYIARSAAPRILSIGVTVASRLPAYCTSMGRVLLSALPADALHRLLVALVPERHTPRTIVQKRALRAEIDRVRERGFAIVDEELELGLRSIAVPVRRAGDRVVAAVNVGVHAARFTPAAMEREILPVLQSAAAEIGQSLIPNHSSLNP